MNKLLEIIEAQKLFNIPNNKIEIYDSSKLIGTRNSKT